ncbi:hypothetical protein SAMN04490190_4520 [Pseudomonas libanensis]|nr:hypothetical protein SAMN04490190_4520 [Pseudomonas libanensis]
MSIIRNSFPPFAPPFYPGQDMPPKLPDVSSKGSGEPGLYSKYPNWFPKEARPTDCGFGRSSTWPDTVADKSLPPRQTSLQEKLEKNTKYSSDQT